MQYPRTDQVRDGRGSIWVLLSVTGEGLYGQNSVSVGPEWQDTGERVRLDSHASYALYVTRLAKQYKLVPPTTRESVTLPSRRASCWVQGTPKTAEIRRCSV